MIHAASFRNFKALRDVQVPLDRFTVLVGPNASGKTSILQGLQRLSDLGFFRPSVVFQGVHDPNVIRSAGTKEPVTLRIEGEWDGLPGEVEVTLSESPTAPPGSDWTYSISGRWGASSFARSQKLFDYFLSEEERRKREAEYTSFLETEALLLARVGLGTTFLRLDPIRLSDASYSEHQVPFLNFDGTGLASVLAHMALTTPEKFRALQEAVRGVIPAVQRVLIDRAPVRRSERESVTINGEAVSRSIEREYWGNRINLDIAGAPNTPAEVVSEGTILVLGLLTALTSGEGRRLVLLDDLDRGLHPRAMEALVGKLRDVLASNPHLQIVGTTHSPYLVDHLSPGEVRLTTLRPDGSAVCGRLEDHPEFERWKDAMLPGEFWSTVGEKWLTQREATTNAVG